MLRHPGFILDSILGGGKGNVQVERERCFQDLGCFNNKPPFHSNQRSLTLLPQDPVTIGTQFFLYTRATWNDTSEAEILSMSDPVGVQKTHFSSARDTKVVVHGFTHSSRRQWVHDMTRELLQHDDMNVIVVDWEKGAQFPYGQAASNTRVVGAQIAQLLATLSTHLNNSHERVHIIGHSLGAHVAGYAGERTPGMARISGLDPSDPYFKNTPPQVRLDPSDAQFVDVIHTDTSTPRHMGMGINQDLGHVDFYPNGGAHQPGCDQDLLSTLTHTVWNAATVGRYAAEGAAACSHLRAIDLFTESINSPCPFRAYPCVSDHDFDQGHCLTCPGNGCSRLGYHADGQLGRGAMYLRTQGSFSFCNYHYQVNMTSENAVDGIITLTIYGDKGRISPTPLTTKNEIINTGVTISHLMTTRTDVGAVNGVGVRYDKSHTPLVNLIYADTWTLRSATLRSGETQNLSEFCAGGESILDQTMAVFHLVGHC
ncbi:hypothetical protein ACOMHN_006296 [Nucella lapillus]